MKKLSLLLTIVLALALVLTACGGNEAPASEEPSPSASQTYKETMVPFDQLIPSDRILILQNTLNYCMDGFYTAETKPVSEEIKYNGKPVQAYPISYTLAFLTQGSKGTVSVFEGEKKTDFSAEEFAGMYVIIDFASDVAPVMYNPKTKAEIKAFDYAITSEGEAIYSIVSGSSHNGASIIEKCGWDKQATYRVVAVDKFYIPVPAAENATGELRGTLSGAINGSFPDLTIASGKINDVIYIEKIVEQ